MAQWKYHGERLETLDNIVVARTCLEGNTHRLADVGNRGQRPREKKQADNSLEGFTLTFNSCR